MKNLKEGLKIRDKRSGKTGIVTNVFRSPRWTTYTLFGIRLFSRLKKGVGDVQDIDIEWEDGTASMTFGLLDNLEEEK